MKPQKKLHFIADDTSHAQTAFNTLCQLYGQTQVKEADILVVLGGDGFLLKILHQFQHLKLPTYGINCGTVGFLMNHYGLDGLTESIENAKPTVLHPLHMQAILKDGQRCESFAINEVALMRASAQAAHIKIEIDGKVRLEELVCDGILVSTPAGSTGYNLSAHGPIIPLGVPLLALTPLIVFRPRRWRGALIPEKFQITLTVIDSNKRPVNLTVDDRQYLNLMQVTIKQAEQMSYTLLFDSQHNLEERILKEQFFY